MSHTPNYDSKIKIILDGLKPGERICEMTGEKWFVDDEEIGWDKKFNVPPSPFSPRVRLWHLASFFSVYQWWWAKHFDTGEPVLSYVHPATGIRVLPDKEWFTRDFSTTNLSFEIDRPFFDLLRELQLKVPINATRNVKEPENSVAMVSMGDKDSYFVAASSSRGCLYLNDSQNIEFSVDCNGAIDVSEGYSLSHCVRMHRCKFSLESSDCLDSSFLFDCRNCEFCFGATNQRNKKYLFFNEQLSKENWEQRVKEVDLGDRLILTTTWQRFIALINEQAVWPENFNQKTEGSIGEYLINSINCRFCYYGLGAAESYYCIGLVNARGNAFCTAIPGDNNLQCWGGRSSNCKFSHTVTGCDDLEYCMNCYNCAHCFGCVGLQRKSFCIFNAQYTEEEYWQKVDELKCAMLERGEYGRPFPMKYSFTYYPESGPLAYMDATEADMIRADMSQFSIDASGAFGESRLEGKTIKKREEAPNNINDFDLTQWVGIPIEDPEIKRPFSYLKPELEFYKKYHLAPPLKHFTTRVRDLMLLMNISSFEDVVCKHCDNKITVAKNRTFADRKIYCRACYNAFIEENN